MKSFINIRTFAVAFLLAVIWLSSCEKFLKEEPKDRVFSANFYKTEEDAIAATNAIYASLGSYFDNGDGPYHSTTWIAMGLASDEMANKQTDNSMDQLDDFAWNAENGAILSIWRSHYKTITVANIAINRIPGIDMDPTLRDRLVNESKFLRALMYFNLVRMYGPIPLITTEDAPINIGVSSVDDVYAQIISDLQSAEALPADGDIEEGRATSGAAKSLLAKVYLTRKEWDKAAAKALEVIRSNKYGLWEHFADVFKQSNRNGKEAIFSVSNGDAGGTISFWEFGQFNVRLLPKELTEKRSNVRNTQGWQVATWDLYNSFSDDDERKSVTFMTEFVADDGSVVKLSDPYFQKYWDQSVEPNGGDSQQDFPVIRYADVLLMYAEAEAELGNLTVANDYLEMVRNRAGLTYVDINDLETFRAEILTERRKELAAEGHRWFDLVRTGQLEERVQAAKGISVNPRYNIFPYPQREIDTNNELPSNSDKGY
ncbi:RagB/SusD family nutrient uptake outer membrane protein [Ilyomonas limi]|uniref:RagB/SusD family nutrient uptake outer membrane protein n=1 Tax=Ilyomonas limi TaxID=2575867 RepID=A0A4V5UVS8_9BACT|nr:RagB/SusD family nutrient uptake outer membrane protein [Ilyomonas limi]TKK66023.1 RagB/SusD family nutrient uptake outer membrane protein [Ilyomonas limi]